MAICIPQIGMTSLSMKGQRTNLITTSFGKMETKEMKLMLMVCSFLNLKPMVGKVQVSCFAGQSTVPVLLCLVCADLYSFFCFSIRRPCGFRGSESK